MKVLLVILIILAVLAIALVGALFTGWLIMLLAGIFGFSLAYWPSAVAAGFIVNVLLAGAGSANR